MKTKLLVLTLCAMAAAAQVQAADEPPQAPQAFPGTKHSLAPLPVEIYNQPGQRPTVAFSTPCIQIERMTNGFPPILAFETFMFTVIGNVNETNMLPLRLEPVCI
jgi:hypothetical protein